MPPPGGRRNRDIRDRFTRELNKPFNERFSTVVAVSVLVRCRCRCRCRCRTRDSRRPRILPHLSWLGRPRLVRIEPHSNAEPRAIAKKRRRSALASLAFLSAPLNGIDGEGQSRRSRTWRSRHLEDLAVSNARARSRTETRSTCCCSCPDGIASAITTTTTTTTTIVCVVQLVVDSEPGPLPSRPGSAPPSTPTRRDAQAERRAGRSALFRRAPNCRFISGISVARLAAPGPSRSARHRSDAGARSCCPTPVPVPTNARSSPEGGRWRT
jgi:hypothetical protein